MPDEVTVKTVKRAFGLAIRKGGSTHLYQDGFHVTHIVVWDEDNQCWFHVCDVNMEVHKPWNDDDNDTTDKGPSCFRCMSRVSMSAWP